MNWPTYLVHVLVHKLSTVPPYSPTQRKGGYLKQWSIHSWYLAFLQMKETSFPFGAKKSVKKQISPDRKGTKNVLNFTSYRPVRRRIQFITPGGHLFIYLYYQVHHPFYQEYIYLITRFSSYYPRLYILSRRICTYMYKCICLRRRYAALSYGISNGARLWDRRIVQFNRTL